MPEKYPFDELKVLGCRGEENWGLDREGGAVERVRAWGRPVYTQHSEKFSALFKEIPVFTHTIVHTLETQSSLCSFHLLLIWFPSWSQSILQGIESGLWGTVEFPVPGAVSICKTQLWHEVVDAGAGQGTFVCGSWL